MSAERILEIPDIPYEPNRVRRELDFGAPTIRLDCRVTGTLQRTAGAVGDAAVQTEQLQRLIPKIRVLADDFDIIPDSFNLKQLWAYHLLNVQQSVALDEVSAAAINAGTAETFEITFSIHFARQYLVNPVDTILPVLPIRNGLYLDITWETAIQGAAGSDQGTGAILSAGTDTYDFTVAPNLEIRQVIAPNFAAEGRQPYAVPIMRQFTSRSFATATANLVERFVNRKRFDLLLFRSFRDDTDNPENTIDEITLESTDIQLLNDEPEWGFEQSGLNTFPAYKGTGAGVQPGPGYLPFLAAPGGRAFSAIDPDRFVDLRLDFKTLAPGGGNGVITVIQAAQQPWRGITQLQG